MTAGIGLAVASDELRAIVVRDAAAVWAMRCNRDKDSDLSAQIADLLSQAPVRRWPRPRVAAALGPSASHVRHLAGLPALTDTRALAALVRENAPRFFLRNGIPLETTGVRSTGAYDGWAGALEQPVVNAIASGCRTAGLRLDAILPAAVALAAALPEAEFCWADGSTRLAIRTTNGSIARLRRAANTSDGSAIAAPVVPQLHRLGDEGWRFADAYGASLVRADEPLALRATARDSVASSRGRLRAAWLAVAASAVFALSAPPTIDLVERARAARAETVLGKEARDAAALNQELRRVSAALSEAADFAASRRSALGLIAAITNALPAGTAVLMLRADSSGGSLALVAPQAAQAIASLDAATGIVSPTAVGPVTRELIGTQELERATVRFALAPSGVR